MLAVKGTGLGGGNGEQEPITHQLTIGFEAGSLALKAAAVTLHQATF